MTYMYFTASTSKGEVISPVTMMRELLYISRNTHYVENNMNANTPLVAHPQTDTHKHTNTHTYTQANKGAHDHTYMPNHTHK